MPSVTAVVVAHNPGEWFEETLDSLTTQDYPRLKILVVDQTGADIVSERVRASVPNATVLEATDTSGFAAGANTVLDTEVESAFVLICHDDVALAPDAVRILVTEALRSNAGITGPKLVDWERPEILQHVGLVVDQFAGAAEVIEPDERDQEQHDAVADVFAVPSACVLVRTSLFATIGGFDPAITRRGDDVDLCWRAQRAGARVIVAPDAVVRHREDLRSRTGVDDIRKTRARHQLRTVLVNSSPSGLVVTLPMMAILALTEAAIAVVTGRFKQVTEVFGAWVWNVNRLGEIRRRRRALRPAITTPHSDIRALQQTGSVRINAFVRGQIGRGENAWGGEIVSAMRTGTTLFSFLAWVLVVGFVIFGSRSLLISGVPAVGDFAAFPDSAGELTSSWWSSWRTRDLGSVGSTPFGLGLLGVVASVLGGAVGLVRTLWVIGPVFVGLIGAWRLLGVTGSRRAQVGTLVTYVALPLPWSAIGSASWSGLAGYAVAPWILRGLLEAQASAPFKTTTGSVRSLLGATVATGVATGFAVVFDPSAVVVIAIIGGGLVAGSLVAVNPTGVHRLVVALVGASIVTAILALPFTLDVLAVEPSWALIAGGRDGSASDLPLLDLVRFAVGPDDPGRFIWAFAVPIAMPLLVGRAWRLDLAVRLSMVALASWGVALAAVSGWLPFGLPTTAVLLAPAAAALAGLCGVAVSASEHDLRRSGFGWRQALLPVAMVAAAIAVVPALGGIETGRWGLARAGYEQTLPFADPVIDGSYRVLWIGAPDHLPADGTPLRAGSAWVATLDGLPDISERLTSTDPASSALIADVLGGVLEGDTARAGRLLGGLGIRYVAVIERLAPAPFSDPPDTLVVPTALTEALDTQLDLRRLAGVNSALEVYENTEWTSVRAAAAGGFDDEVKTLNDLRTSPLSGTVGVLVGTDDNITATVPDQTEILVAQSPDLGWSLRVDDVTSVQRQALGWATVYLPAAGGEATLAYVTPVWRQYVVVLQLLLFVAIGSAFLRRLLARRT